MAAIGPAQGNTAARFNEIFLKSNNIHVANRNMYVDRILSISNTAELVNMCIVIVYYVRANIDYVS
jgi:hypothetical protein